VLLYVFADLQEEVQRRLAAAELAHREAIAFAESAQIKVTASEDELQRRLEQRARIWAALSETVKGVAALAPPPTAAIAGLLLGIGSAALNIGLAADGSRKDKLLVKRNGATPGTVAT